MAPVRSIFGTWVSMACLLLTLGACRHETSTTAPAVSYTVGGTVSGLSGAGLGLQLNGAGNLAISANGSFTFTGGLTAGSNYQVVVQTQPNGPAQTCTVANGSGTVGGANVSNVTVSCVTNTYTVGGSVAGLSGSGLVLQLNSANNLAVAAAGNFVFASPISSGTAYTVSVATQPVSPAQNCTVAGGSGTVAAANVSSVAVSCTTTAPAVAEIPVAVNGPLDIQDLFTSVSFDPPFRVGAIYVGGRNGITTTTALSSALLATIDDVTKVRTTGGLTSNSGVFILSERDSAVYVFRPSTLATSRIHGPNQIVIDMQMNRTTGRLLTVDVEPVFRSVGQAGPLIQVWNTETADAQFRFNIAVSRGGIGDPARCPCTVAADPANFDTVYAFSRGSDTVTVSTVKLSASATENKTGSVAIANPASSNKSLGQMVADASSAFVTDSQGRLHKVTINGTSATGALELSETATNVVIQGNLLRDEAPSSSLFFDVGLGPNPPAVGGSSIRVYNSADPSLNVVATIPTSSNAIGPFAFGATEIFFWDGSTLKAVRRANWTTRTIAGAPTEGSGNPLLYDDFSKTILYGSAARNVVFAVDATPR